MEKKSLICCGHSLKYPNPISDARRVHILYQFDYAHIGHVGRILRNDTLTVSERNLVDWFKKPIYPVIVASIETMEEALNMDVPAEVYFIAQLVKNAQCIEDKITEIDTLD